MDKKKILLKTAAQLENLLQEMAAIKQNQKTLLNIVLHSWNSITSSNSKSINECQLLFIYINKILLEFYQSDSRIEKLINDNPLYEVQLENDNVLGTVTKSERLMCTKYYERTDDNSKANSTFNECEVKNGSETVSENSDNSSNCLNVEIAAETAVNICIKDSPFVEEGRKILIGTKQNDRQTDQVSVSSKLPLSLLKPFEVSETCLNLPSQNYLMSNSEEVDDNDLDVSVGSGVSLQEKNNENEVYEEAQTNFKYDVKGNTENEEHEKLITEGVMKCDNLACQSADNVLTTIKSDSMNPFHETSAENVTNPEDLNNVNGATYEDISIKNHTFSTLKPVMKCTSPRIEIENNTLPRIGDEFFISHIENPSEFYISAYGENTSLLNLLTGDLREYYKGTISFDKSKEEVAEDIGDYCVAYVAQYDTWFRTRVLDWCFDVKTEYVFTQQIDFGRKYHLSYRNLRKITEEFIAIPPLAVKCHLAGTRGQNYFTWPQESVQAMMGNKIFRISRVRKETNSDSVEIDLYYPETNVSLTQLLSDFKEWNVAELYH